MINAREHLFRHGSVEGALIFTQPIARFADRTRGNTSDQARSARRAGLGVQFVDFLQKLTLPPSLPSSSRPRYTDCPNGVSGTLILAVTDATNAVVFVCVNSFARRFVRRLVAPPFPPRIDQRSREKRRHSSCCPSLEHAWKCALIRLGTFLEALSSNRAL